MWIWDLGIRFIGDLDICDRLVMPKAKHWSTKLGLGGGGGGVEWNCVDRLSGNIDINLYWGGCQLSTKFLQAKPINLNTKTHNKSNSYQVLPCWLLYGLRRSRYAFILHESWTHLVVTQPWTTAWWPMRVTQQEREVERNKFDYNKF